MERVTDGNWSPLWWEPDVWPGSTFTFAARLHGCPPGAIRGGTMFLDGREFPVRTDQDRITATVQAEDTVTLQRGGSAQIYLDVVGLGRVLWLNGLITGGGSRP